MNEYKIYAGCKITEKKLFIEDLVSILKTGVSHYSKKKFKLKAYSQIRKEVCYVIYEEFTWKGNLHWALMFLNEDTLLIEEKRFLNSENDLIPELENIIRDDRNDYFGLTVEEA